MNDPVDDLLSGLTPARAAYCQKAAELHLQRAIALASTEWKVSLAFWGVLIASGVSFISYTAQSSPPMTVYIAHSDIIFLIPYLISAALFVFGFSVNQARSIVEERTRYRYFLNEAAIAVGHGYRLKDADPDKPFSIMFGSRVWAHKLLSTFLFVTGVWAGAQWLAHGKLVAARLIANDPRYDLAQINFNPGTVACAFFDCRNRGFWIWTDQPEVGTTIWLACFGAVLLFFIEANSAGGR